MNNCQSAPDGLDIFDTATGSTDDRRRAAYDNGLRCWDRDVTVLVEPFLKRRGAVYIVITADHSELMAENGSWVTDTDALGESGVAGLVVGIRVTLSGAP